jgi:hypothetical protein
VIKQILIIFSLFLGFTSKAQEIKYSGLVLDKKTGLGIPFATVIVYSKIGINGTYTDSLGNFAISKTIPPDSICISIIGYETYKIFSPKSIEKKIIKLIQKIYPLNEVTVYPPIEKTIGTKKNGFISRNHGAPRTIRGSYITNNNYNNAYIKEVIYKLHREKTYYNSCLDMVRVHLYKFNIKDSLPGEEMLPEDVIVYINSKTQLPLKVNLSKYNIKLPPEGIIVGYEYLGTFDKNSKEVNFDICNDLTILNISSKNPSLLSYSSSLDRGIGWSIYRNDNGSNKYFLFELTIQYNP